MPLSPQEGAMTGRWLYLSHSDKVKTCCSVVPCIVHLRWLNTLFSPLYREQLAADVTIVILVLAILIAFFCLVLTLHTYIHTETHIPNSVRATKLLYQLLYCFWYQQQRTSLDPFFIITHSLRDVSSAAASPTVGMQLQEVLLVPVCILHIQEYFTISLPCQCHILTLSYKLHVAIWVYG